MQFKYSAAILGALAALGSTLSLQAQCYESQTGTSIGTGDDTLLPIQALGFAFPFGGATYTNVHVCTNGFVYLSNSGTPAPGGTNLTATTAVLVGGSPMIAAYWSDLNVQAGTGTVKFNALAGKAVITWENTVEYGDTNQFSVQLQLMSTGEIDMAYDGRCQVRTAGDFIVGMSEGGGATLPAASNFAVTNTSTTTTNFQIFNNTTLPFTLTGQTIQFVAAAPGYVWIPGQCAGANVSYGSGCYSVSNSAYQLITSPTAASAAMAGTGVVFIPSGSNYLLTPGGTYVPPSGSATVLTLTDDSSVITPALTSAFAYPGGTTTALSVCSNGHVAVAAGNSNIYSPTAATMLANPQTAWYSWHDFNPAAVGSGSVKFEQVGSVAYITWDGVYSYSGTTAAAANTMQFQFDTASGTVTIVWVSISTNSHTLPAGEPWLAGYSPGGASVDGGSLSFATQLPYLTNTIEQIALAMNASGTPPTTGTGSTITYTISNTPEFVPSSGLYIALHMLSLSQVPAPGIDLAFLGAPGCPLLLGSLDLIQSLIGASSTATSTLTLPAGLPAGLTVYSQGAALFSPNSLPGGQNAFGAETSNAIATRVGTW